jgi:hypothetical protein
LALAVLAIGENPEDGEQALYTQGNGGELVFALAGTVPDREYGRMVVDEEGFLSLDGTLTVEFVNGFTPQIGQSFDLITAPGRDGDFERYLVPMMPGPKAFHLAWSDAARLTLNVVQPEPIESVGGGSWTDENTWSTFAVPETHSHVILSGGGATLFNRHATVHSVTIAGQTLRINLGSLLATDRIVVQDGGTLTLFPLSGVTSPLVHLQGGTLRGEGTVAAPVIVDEATIHTPNTNSMITLQDTVSFAAGGSLVKTGPGILSIEGAISGEGDLNVQDGKLIAPATKLDSLTISGASSVFQLRPDSGTLVLNNFTISDAAAPLEFGGETAASHGTTAIPEPTTSMLTVALLVMLAARSSFRAGCKSRRDSSSRGHFPGHVS